MSYNMFLCPPRTFYSGPEISTSDLSNVSSKSATEIEHLFVHNFSAVLSFDITDLEQGGFTGGHQRIAFPIADPRWKSC